MNKFFVGSCTAFVVLAGCSSSSDSVSTPSRSIELQFAAEASGTTIACDAALSGLGTAGTDASLRDFRFYIHDIELIDLDGTRYFLDLTENGNQSGGLALLDFQDQANFCADDAKATYSVVSGEVEADDSTVFNGIAFTVGVPAESNHQDVLTAEAPLDVSSLFWAWQSGYKFMRLDIAPSGGVTRPSDAGFNNASWNLHLGSTGCAGEPSLGETVTCSRNNRPEIEISDFDPDTDTVLIDYGQLISNNNLGQDEGGAPGCMSGATDPECAAVFTALGMDVVTGEMDTSLTQTVFSVQ